jgi:IS30 family transposase
MRYPRGKRLPQGRGQLINTIPIHQRPAEATGRSVPGHWEDDLVLGKRPSAVLTLGPAIASAVAIVEKEDRPAWRPSPGSSGSRCWRDGASPRTRPSPRRS